MSDDLSQQNIRSCPTCGGVVTLQGVITKYFAPVDPEILSRIADHMDGDNFIRDRLQRAEHIIVDLRKKLADAEQRLLDS